MREAIITLQCSSQDQISLMNADIKLLAKLSAKRLQVFLLSIIFTDQTGSRENRYSFCKIRCLLNRAVTVWILPFCSLDINTKKFTSGHLNYTGL